MNHLAVPFKLVLVGLVAGLVVGSGGHTRANFSTGECTNAAITMSGSGDDGRAEGRLSYGDGHTSQHAVKTPDVLIEICDWQGDAAGAASVSIDDSCTSCLDILRENGFKGTYYLSCTDQFSPADWDMWRSIYAEGHEIGGHTTSHKSCHILDEATLRWELSSNRKEILTNLGMPEEELSSFAWPSGDSSAASRAIAGEYYVCARGYHCNELEDKNPRDFMNLRSLNTPHYHPAVYDPPDYFKKADEAESLGKWVNYVFHNKCQDDGAISYLAKKDLWVAPVGKVAKYIKERQSSGITDIVRTDSQISCVLQGSLDPRLYNEELTIKVRVGRLDVEAVLVNGNLTSFTGTTDHIMFNVQPSGSDDIRVVKSGIPRAGGNDVSKPREDPNGTILRPLRGLEKGNGAVINIWILGQARLDNLRNHKIKYLFVDVGDTQRNGKIGTPKEQIVAFLRLMESYEKQHGYDFIILPYSEINTYNYDVNHQFRKAFIADYKRLVSLGFDGVYVDIEPVRRDQEKDYLELLKNLSAICPEGTILGVYAGSVSDYGDDNEGDNEWEWPLSFYRKVSDVADLICVPGYDFNLPSKADYEAYIRNQVRLLSDGGFNSHFMFTVPTHKRQPETIENALSAYNLEIGRHPRHQFIGVCVFAEWRTTPADWEVFRSGT